MEISALGNVVNPTVSASQRADESLDDNFETMIQLLMTQLQNQDPTEPLDANQFTQELVAFSEVEQGINTNKNLEELIALTKSNSANNVVMMGSALIDRYVEIEGNTADLVQGKAQFGYQLDRNVQETHITILDQYGSVVYEGKGEKTQGSHDFIWDGKDADGFQLLDGNYRIQVKAITTDEKEIHVASTILDKVEAVKMENGSAMLTVGGMDVAMDKVISVHATDPYAAPTAESSLTGDFTLDTLITGEKS